MSLFHEVNALKDLLPCWWGGSAHLISDRHTKALAFLSLCKTKINDFAIHTCISSRSLQIIFPAHNCVPCSSVVRGSLVTVSLRALDSRLAANQSWVLWALANERLGQLVTPKGKLTTMVMLSPGIWHPTMPGLMRHHETQVSSHSECDLGPGSRYGRNFVTGDS